MPQASDKQKEIFDRTRQFDRKRAALILEAAHAFHEQGYAGTTLDQIANRLGVTKKALYRYVSGKSEILYEIFCLWLDLQQSAIERAKAAPGSTTEKIRLYAHTYIENMYENLVPTERIVGELRTLSDEQVQEIQSRRRQSDEQLSALFSEGKPREFAEFESRILVHVLNGAIDWIFKWYNPSGQLTPAKASEKVIDVLLNGMLAR